MKIPFQMVQVQVTCADISGLLYELNIRGIGVHYVRRIDELTVRFCIRQSQYYLTLNIVKRVGGSLDNCIPASGRMLLQGLIRRPVLIFGGVLLLLMTLYLPTRILFVTVSGNDRIPERRILDYASTSGVFFGAVRRDIRSEMVKNRLLSALPELKWVGVNTTGCVAEISVRERAPIETSTRDQMIGNIIASSDGVIREMTVISGNPVCKVGQAVAKGDLLVSGYSDCGRCIYITGADAEIYAHTMHSLQLTMMTEGVQKGSSKGSKRKYGLLVGKKRKNFFKGSGISDATCVRMYVEYPLTLPGGFQLPIALTVQEVIDFDTVPFKDDLRKAEMVLTQSAKAYLESWMIAGEVEHEDYQFAETEGALHLIGHYTCDEMIGQLRSEEIVKENE